jgi:hypothetical protein
LFAICESLQPIRSNLLRSTTAQVSGMVHRSPEPRGRIGKSEALLQATLHTEREGRAGALVTRRQRSCMIAGIGERAQQEVIRRSGE